MNIATLRFWRAYLGEDRLTEAQRSQIPARRAAGAAALALMDKHLVRRHFFVADRLSLADICLYAYTHVAAEGGFDLSLHPAIGRWLDAVAGGARISAHRLLRRAAASCPLRRGGLDRRHAPAAP